MASNLSNENGNEHAMNADKAVEIQEVCVQTLNINGPTEESKIEITLTDQLNKRLLDSFLQRLNQFQPNPSVSSDVLEHTEQDEFVDDDNWHVIPSD